MVRYAGMPVPIVREKPKPEVKQKTFKAKIDVIPYCPECGQLMELTKSWGKESERLYACKAESCMLYGTNFELPEITIKRYTNE